MYLQQSYLSRSGKSIKGAFQSFLSKACVYLDLRNNSKAGELRVTKESQ